jgi:SNF2 family DNA or RNA helicase
MAQKEAESDTPWAHDGGDVLPALTFARMRAELSKVPAILEHIAEAVEEGLSVVVFVNFLPTVDAIASLSEEKFKPGLIYGEQAMEDRTFQINQFQAGAARILVSTIDSGGASISLHDLDGRFPRLALVCPTWRATSLRQALGRVHRAGSKTKTVQKLLYAAGSIEEDVAQRVMRKLDQIDSINDADLAEPEFVSELR